jgi:hypothetical protein
MTLSTKLLAALAIFSLTFSASPTFAAANNGGSEPTVGGVCLTAFELCATGCDAEFPDSGLDFNEYISNQLCKRQCVDQLDACIATGGDGSSSPARKQSVRKLKTAGFDFKGDGTPNNNPAPPTGGTEPADPTGGKPTDGGFTFNPGAITGAQAVVVIQ